MDYNGVMTNGEIFIPNPEHEAERLLVVEHALGEGGLIDRHLGWVGTHESPSAAISDTDYGYVPPRFGGDNCGMRPSREPVEFQSLATTTLGLPYDTEYSILVDRVNEVDSGWYAFLEETGLLSYEQVNAMRVAGQGAYRFDTLTEDNLPAYIALLLGKFQAEALAKGVRMPATDEWSTGIWGGEEYGHVLTMNEYGNITGILKSLEHSAGRTSQLRAGIEIALEHVIKVYAYVSWQELSTNYAHVRKAKLFGPVGHALLVRIGQDEAKHHDLYQGVLEQLFVHFPDDTIRTLNSLFRFPGLDMPGKKGIPDFNRRGVRMHNSGIFRPEDVFRAAQSVVKKLGILDENKAIESISTEGHIALRDLRDRFSSSLNDRRRLGKFVLGAQGSTIADLSGFRRTYSKQMGLPQKRTDAA